ncbi:MAG: hypothetical protein QMD01_05165 [Thermodesulfovibrionales bacterium]|nr:hypothetical protein [Thermodesulfovibrionales bacterium]
MDINQAEKNIKRAWLLSAIAIPAFIASIYLSNIIKINLYLFMPWLFPGIFMLPELVIVSVLTFMVRKKNRVAAVLLLGVYILDRGFTYLWLYVFGTVFIIIWLCVTLIWGLIFIQGIRGTFAYHRLKGTMTSES